MFSKKSGKVPSHMIRFFLVFNRLGAVRLVKWYSAYTPAEKEKLKTDLHRSVCRRKPSLTNVLEYKNYKIIYRPYAALYFCMCVDATDNEFAVLETLHLFVETMDLYFGKVRELDLLVSFHKVYAILDEFIVAGEVGEFNKEVIVNRVKQLDALD
jgi:AP-2 complex subunit sigma-1